MRLQAIKAAQDTEQPLTGRAASQLSFILYLETHAKQPQHETENRDKLCMPTRTFPHTLRDTRCASRCAPFEEQPPPSTFLSPHTPLPDRCCCLAAGDPSGPCCSAWSTSSTTPPARAAAAMPSPSSYAVVTADAGADASSSARCCCSCSTSFLPVKSSSMGTVSCTLP